MATTNGYSQAVKAINAFIRKSIPSISLSSKSECRDTFLLGEESDEQFEDYDYTFHFDFKGSESPTPSSFLKNLFRLPEHIRDQIYQLVVIRPSLISPNYPTYWLLQHDVLINPRPSQEHLDACLPYPTLERKAGWFEHDGKDMYTASQIRTSFWAIRHCAEDLRGLYTTGYEYSDHILQDFLRWVGQSVVFELNEMGRVSIFSPTKAVIPWVKTLKPFLPFIRHVSLQYYPFIEAIHPEVKRVPTLAELDRFPKMLELIRTSMPHLKSAILWIAIPKSKLDQALLHPENTSWIKAIKSLGLKKVEVKLLVMRMMPVWENQGRVWRIYKFGFTRNGLPLPDARRLVWWRPDRKAGYSTDPSKELMLRCILSKGWESSLTDDVDDEVGVASFGELMT